MYHRIDKDSDNLGRLFVRFKHQDPTGPISRWMRATLRHLPGTNPYPIQYMPKSHHLSILALAFLVQLSACSTTGAPPEGPGSPAVNAVVQETTPSTLPPAGAMEPVDGAPSPTDAKLNPPHGEPGHRCEIPVGAPLDGTPATTGTVTTPSAGATPARPDVPTASTPNLSSGKINPPHGEPGHDCAVPVGSPLPG